MKNILWEKNEKNVVSDILDPYQAHGASAVLLQQYVQEFALSPNQATASTEHHVIHQLTFFFFNFAAPVYFGSLDIIPLQGSQN